MSALIQVFIKCVLQKHIVDRAAVAAAMPVNECIGIFTHRDNSGRELFCEPALRRAGVGTVHIVHICWRSSCAPLKGDGILTGDGDNRAAEGFDINMVEHTANDLEACSGIAVGEGGQHEPRAGLHSIENVYGDRQFQSAGQSGNGQLAAKALSGFDSEAAYGNFRHFISSSISFNSIQAAAPRVCRWNRAGATGIGGPKIRTSLL